MGIAVSGIVLTFDHQGQPLRREYRPEDVADNEHGGVLIGRQNHTGSLLNLEPVEVAGEDASDSEGGDGSTSLGGYLTEDGKANFVSPVMSRCHASIFFVGDTKVAIRDEDSHHGTYIERAGRESFRVENPHSTLRTGDTIIFGRTVHKAGQAFDPLRAKVKILYKLNRARRASSSLPTSYGLPEDMDDVGSEDIEDLSSGPSDAESSSSSSVDSVSSYEEDPEEPPVLKAPVTVLGSHFPEVHDLHSTCGTPSSTRAERCSVAGDVSVPGGYDEEAWLGVGPLPTMNAVPVPVEEPVVQLPTLGNHTGMGWVDRVGQAALEHVIEEFVPEAVTSPEYINVDDDIFSGPAHARNGTPSDMDIEVIEDDKSTGAEGQDELDEADEADEADDDVVEIPAEEVGHRISTQKWTPEPIVSPVPFNSSLDLFSGMKRPWRHLENSVFSPPQYPEYCGTSMLSSVPYFNKPPTLTLPPILSGNLPPASSNIFSPASYTLPDSSPLRPPTESKASNPLPTEGAGPSHQEKQSFEKDKEALAQDLKKAAAIGKELEDMMGNWKKSVEDRNKDQNSLKEEMAEVKDYIRMLRGSKDRARVREKRHRKATDDTFNDIREELQTLKLVINEALTKLADIEKEGSKDELKALSENIREVTSDLGDLRVSVRTDFSDLKAHHATMVGEIEDLRERYGASRETTRELTTSLKRKFDVVEFELIEAAVKCQERIEKAAEAVKAPAPPEEREPKRSRLAGYSAAVAIGAVATYVGLGFL